VWEKEEIMANMINFTEEMGLTTKNSTTVKNKAKEVLNDILMQKVVEEFGAENVSEVFKDANGKGYAVSVAVGTVKDEGGYEIEVCVNIELTAKAITTTSRKTSTGVSVTDIYDRLTEAEVYANAVKSKEEEKAKKEKEKETKKAKDAKRREELRIAREKAKEEKTKEENGDC
jgi:transposase